MLQQVSGNDRRYDVGEVCSLPDAQAVRWIDAGFAEAVDDESDETRDETPVLEAAAVADAPERATLPRAQKR